MRIDYIYKWTLVYKISIWNNSITENLLYIFVYQKKITKVLTYCPKFDKILQVCSSNKKAVEQRISQEKEEKFIIWKSDTIVHPVNKTKTTSQWVVHFPPTVCICSYLTKYSVSSPLKFIGISLSKTLNISFHIQTLKKSISRKKKLVFSFLSLICDIALIDHEPHNYISCPIM